MTGETQTIAVVQSCAVNTPYTTLIPWLLLGVLVLPIACALLARLAAQWLGPRALGIFGGAGFVGAIICVVTLSLMPPDATALGRLRVFLPSSDVVVPSDSFVELPTAPPAALIVATATATSTTTPTATPTVPPSPTLEPTATTTPTDVPPPPTEAPPPPTQAPPPPTQVPAPPPPTQAPSRQPRRYVVESGDTLRGIAERFDVSVEELLRYNGLSAEEADSLQPGQELFIPPQ